MEEMTFHAESVVWGQTYEVLVKRGDRFDTVPIAYAGGLRFPWLEPVGAGEHGFDRLLAARMKP